MLAGQFMTATRFAQAEWCARKEFYTGPRNAEQEEKNPCRGLMGKKSKERVPASIGGRVGLTWPEKRSRSRARASSVFCERKRRDPEEPGDDADLPITRATAVRYRRRSTGGTVSSAIRKSDPAARRD